MNLKLLEKIWKKEGRVHPACPKCAKDSNMLHAYRVIDSYRENWYKCMVCKTVFHNEP